METHADQCILQKSQPPGKENNASVGYIAVLTLLVLIITLEINPYIISYLTT